MQKLWFFDFLDCFFDIVDYWNANGWIDPYFLNEQELFYTSTVLGFKYLCEVPLNTINVF